MTDSVPSEITAVYARYLQDKTAWMQRLLLKHGFSDHAPTITAFPPQGGYRSRVKIKIYRHRGAMELKGTHPFRGEVAIEEMLWILPEWGRKLARLLSDHLLRRADFCPVDGFELQLTHGCSHAHVMLSVKDPREKPCAALAQELMDIASELTGVAIPSLRRSWGDDYLRHWILEMTLSAHFRAFFQSHLFLTSELLVGMKAHLEAYPHGKIFDLYCGVGLYSHVLGRPDTEILGVDNNPEAVSSARLNAESRGYDRAQYICSSVERFLKGAVIGPEDLVFINPPRSGCDGDIVTRVSRDMPGLICLVSCYLDTHIRDLRFWREQGFLIRTMEAYDMFPFTPFLETVTFLAPAG